ncbi:MAG: peptidoglycan-binding protein, partial [Geminicoccaceae bacterium]
AQLFIPILTPNFFHSDFCRNEALAFLDYEAASGRDDLILPIYLLEADVLEVDALRADDIIAERLLERQHRDWRALAFALQDAGTRPRIAELAADIARAAAKQGTLSRPDLTSDHAGGGQVSDKQRGLETPIPNEELQRDLGLKLTQTQEAKRRHAKGALQATDARDEADSIALAERGDYSAPSHRWPWILAGGSALAATIFAFLVGSQSTTDSPDVEQRFARLEAKLNNERQARAKAEAETNQVRAQLESLQRSIQPAAGPDVVAKITLNALRTRNAQIMLQALGFYYGRVDGLPGDGTRRGISSFQTKIGGKPTGEFTTEQWGALELAFASRQPDRSG